MVVVLDIHAQIFELFDEKLDLVLFWVSAHVTKFFVFISSYDLINHSCNSIRDGDFCLVRRT